MNPIQYFTLAECTREVFPFIYEELTKMENAPLYEKEITGMQELEKVLRFMQNDDYYKNFCDKASYLVCSIAGSQYFSNGNKRLAVASLAYFLIKNNIQVRFTKIFDVNITDEEYLLRQFFPNHSWENESSLDTKHTVFLYNLALVLGDRNKWGTNDFGELRTKVSSMFDNIYWFNRFL